MVRAFQELPNLAAAKRGVTIPYRDSLIGSLPGCHISCGTGAPSPLVGTRECEQWFE